MKRRSRRPPIRAALAAALLAAALLGFSSAASAGSYSVSYNPYGSVDWSSTLRCQSEHHDHAYDVGRVTALSNSGYCAIAFMTYSGDFRPTPYAAWLAAGSPNPDPGLPTGWAGYRRWPPETHGAPALPLNSLRFYLPGAEEVGLIGGTPQVPYHTSHMLAVGLTDYIEGVGCESCGNEGSAVRNDNPLGLPDSHRYSSTQDFVAKAIALGAIPVAAHPNGPPNQLDMLDPHPQAVEMYNNFHALRDDGSAAGVPGCFTGETHYIDEMRAVWDHVLEEKSPRIWGIAVNDWASAWTPLGPSATACWPEITEANRDRGKTLALVPSFDLQAYMAAFAAGAFFAVVEDNAVKSAYPTVSDIDVTFDRITISTAAGTETVRWIGNGELIGEGNTLVLTNIADALVYARAEIDDGDGRTVFTQPFSLGPQAPPPPGEPIPLLPDALTVALLIALLAVAIQKSQGLAKRA